MAITTSVGVGSGIDISGTVSQLTAAEGKPQLDAIAAKQTTSQTKLSGLGTLKGALSAFQSAVSSLNKNTTFQSQTITSSDEKVLKVAIDPGATASSHTIKVNTIAKPQKSVSTIEFSSTDVVNAGTLVFNDKDGTPKFSVEITSGVNDSLTGVRDAINNATGNNTVIASIINVDSKTKPGTTVSKLVLTAKTAGVANSFTVNASLGDSRLNLNSIETPANFNTIEAIDTNITIDAQKVAASAQRSVANKEFTTSSDVIAPGVLTFKNSAGLEEFSVTIVEGVNDKLYSAMEAINNAPGNSNITASVINVESKTNPGTMVSKLVFTAKKPGTDNKFTIDASKGDANFSLDSSAVNAQKTTFSAEFTDTTKVTPGTINFKDATGEVKFSVDVIASTSKLVKEDGSELAVDTDGNPILVDAEGNTIPTKTVTTEGNDSLESLRDAINFSPENKLVLASIVKTDSTTEPGTTVSKLVLTALGSGSTNGFTVDASAGDTRFTLDPNEAVNPEGAVKFISTTTSANYDTAEAENENEGGQSVTTSSNTITDAIPGTTLTVIAEGSATIDSQSDTSSVAKPISAFVDAYNKLNDALKQLTNYVGPGDANNGPLLGDSTIKNIASQLKQIINSKVVSATGDYNSLNQLGITFDKKGIMTLDSSKLNASLSANLTSVANVFSSANGVAAELNSKITQYLDSKGVLSSLQETENKKLAALDAQKIAVNTRLAATQKSLQKQFVAMDNAVSQFKNTGTLLTQFISSQTKSNNNS